MGSTALSRLKQACNMPSSHSLLALVASQWPRFTCLGANSLLGIKPFVGLCDAAIFQVWVRGKGGLGGCVM